ncbi:hypothetical protein [Neobacillus drentensis]|uniref:hypothetical protein n=1 Tax=Neobacillus drentensis TaxID=220684 RepID=UPI002FFDADA6
MKLRLLKIISLNFVVAMEDEEILFNWSKEICKYRLHYLFERKAKNFQIHKKHLD